MLACRTCKEERPLPKHCGQAMHKEIVEGTPMLVCWMGPECGKQSIPEHCGSAMEVRAEAS